MTTAQNYRLTNVETGYAKVRAQLKTGQRERLLGSVSQAKHGSTRTGTIWTATTVAGHDIGTAYTRDEAIRLLLNR